MKRREFIILTCATFCGCAEQSGSNQPISLKPVSIDAGSATDGPLAVVITVRAELVIASLAFDAEATQTLCISLSGGYAHDQSERRKYAGMQSLHKLTPFH